MLNNKSPVLYDNKHAVNVCVTKYFDYNISLPNVANCNSRTGCGSIHNRNKTFLCLKMFLCPVVGIKIKGLLSYISTSYWYYCTLISTSYHLLSCYPYILVCVCVCWSLAFKPNVGFEIQSIHLLLYLLHYIHKPDATSQNRNKFRSKFGKVYVIIWKS